MMVLIAKSSALLQSGNDGFLKELFAYVHVKSNTNNMSESRFAEMFRRLGLKRASVLNKLTSWIALNGYFFSLT